MSFRDRISGESVEQPPEPTLFGRWIFDPSDGLGPVHVNGRPADAGDVLAPGATGDWALVRTGDTIPTRGGFLADALPDEQDVEALLQLGEQLQDRDKVKGGWLEWRKTSPLAPGLEKAVRPHSLEDCIEDEIDHLVAVCRKPRTHIRVDTERVLVARARRIAPGAPAWLASHTEDWDHRKITGIEPRRILAEVREERWDIYENRVAVRLVDNLVEWLRQRIAEVSRVLDDILVRMDFASSASGTRHRADRIYRLWGETWEASHGRDIAERTLRRLEHLLYRLLGLMDSKLYRHISRRTPAPRSLRMTNLLSNDDDYHGIARLWHDWSRLAAPRPLSLRQLYARHQDLHHAFDAWCMLVIVRACSQLGLDPTENEDLESEIRPGGAVQLGKGYRIEWEPAGAIKLANEDRPLLRFVPLIHVLEHAKGRESVATRVASLVEAVAAANHWTVILHPAVPGEPPHDTLAGIGNPPDPRTHDGSGFSGAIDFMRVSPFSIDTVERVSRAIRWATLVPRMLSYPPTLPAIRGHDIRNGTWRVNRGETHWALVRPLHPGELSELNIVGRLETARKDRDCKKQEREKVEDELRQARRDGRRTPELRRRLRLLLEPLRVAEDAVKRWEEFERHFRKACDSLTTLTTCPACRQEGAEFEPRDDCFAARCSSTSCGCEWELRPGPGGRIPVFSRSGTDLDARAAGGVPNWVDDVLGCDVLAIPVERDGGIQFLPPRSGRLGVSLKDSLRQKDGRR